MKVRVLAVVAMLFLTGAGCTPQAPPPAGTSPTGPSASPTASSTTSGGPLVWFAPLDPLTAAAGGKESGLIDFFDLFKPTAPWTTAAAHVQVFKFYTWIVDPAAGLSDVQLADMVADLKRRHIAIGLEAGSMTPTAQCGRGIEGQGGPDVTLKIMRRIQSVGGSVGYVAMDEPFYFWSLDTSANACRYSATRVAQEVARYIQVLKSVFPKTVIGDIEPDTVQIGQMEEWIEAYHAASGSFFPFVHWDVSWQRSDWPQRAKSLETYSRERGIAFGMIYNGNGDESSDLEWLRNAEDHMVRYETIGAGHPQHVIFQSWNLYPKHGLPETDPSKFTHLIDRYFAIRTRLALTLSSATGSWAAVGDLTEAASGNPIAGATVDLSLWPLDGPGEFGLYSFAGLVPSGATSAVVGFRVNAEDAGNAASDFSLYSATYSEGASAANRVPNGDLARGNQGWALWGTSRSHFEPSDRSTGTMVRVTATASESALLNSASFSVTGGARFMATFAARISPTSVGSGYFAVIFLGPDEIQRQRLPLQPRPLVSTATTDRSGHFGYAWAGLRAQPVRVDARWAGDGDRWPGLATVTG